MNTPPENKQDGSWRQKRWTEDLGVFANTKVAQAATTPTAMASPTKRAAPRRKIAKKAAARRTVKAR